MEHDKLIEKIRKEVAKTSQRAEDSESDLKKIIDAVEWYQKQRSFHPLTCGNFSGHGLLYAVEEKGRVVLKCPDCDYIQTNVPGFVAGTYSNKEDSP